MEIRMTTEAAQKDYVSDRNYAKRDGYLFVVYYLRDIRPPLRDAPRPEGAGRCGGKRFVN
jgi:hypothetical protein